MSAPSTAVVLVCAYAVCLLVVAVLFDRLGARSALRSAAWRTGNFVYHDDADAWKCHEDQWLWPASFDPDKRVIRYAGQHAICGRCPAKPECSPTPGPRELTRQVDPWPHSEAGRFHRGVSLAIGAVALMMVLAMLLFGATDTADVILLLAALALVVAVGIPLARHLWDTPDGFPQHLEQESADTLAGTADDVTEPGEVPVRRRFGYRSDRLSAAGAGAGPLTAAAVDDVLARHGVHARRGDAARGAATAPTALPTPRYRSDRLAGERAAAGTQAPSRRTRKGRR